MTERSPRTDLGGLPDHDCACGYCACAVEHYEARKAAEADRDKFRAALERIADPQAEVDVHWKQNHAAMLPYEIARDALNG